MFELLFFPSGIQDFPPEIAEVFRLMDSVPQMDNDGQMTAIYLYCFVFKFCFHTYNYILVYAFFFVLDTCSYLVPLIISGNIIIKGWPLRRI